MTVTSRHVTIDGSSQFVTFYTISLNPFSLAYKSTSGSDITVTNLIFPSNDSPEVAWHVTWSEDNGNGNSLFLYVNIVIIGA